VGSDWACTSVKEFWGGVVPNIGFKTKFGKVAMDVTQTVDVLVPLLPDVAQLP
jgi:hypothetical protein